MGEALTNPVRITVGVAGAANSDVVQVGGVCFVLVGWVVSLLLGFGWDAGGAAAGAPMRQLQRFEACDCVSECWALVLHQPIQTGCQPHDVSYVCWRMPDVRGTHE